MNSLRTATCCLIAAIVSPVVSVQAAGVHHIQGEMTGEVTASSAILQSRLTAAKVDETGDVPGAPGFARFIIADNVKFNGSATTKWMEAKPSYDYIIKTVVRSLKPGTRYYYRLESGTDKTKTAFGPTRSFRTLYAPDVATKHSFVVVTGMNFNKFHNGGARSAGAYKGKDKHLGYPALASILKLDPDFFIGTGDNVYYDGPRATSAGTPAQVRKKWHEQFVQPRYVDLFARVPTYWEKDDHDFRYDDCDLTGDMLPTVALGLRAFQEQIPIVDPKDPNAVTYRTHRVGKLLQIWMPENRDYRSPNLSPETPEKTVWGVKQREWIKKTLAESDATFKLFISPTPMVGPDDIHKRDNHTDVGGFRHEGIEFFEWAKKNDLLEKGLYFVCGDRHWQYHSIHPMGFEEFSCGALVDANSRLGMKPGNKKSTDPDAKIKQPYTSNPASGGFLNVVVEPPKKSGGKATLNFDFYNEQGKRLHQVTKTR
jgi:alkaline phosphatase D